MIITKVGDAPGKEIIETGRMLVLAVGSEDDSGAKVGDIIYYTNDVDLFPGAETSFGKKKRFKSNPSCQLTTYKKAYLEEEDPNPCVQIWSGQVQAIDNAEDFIFKDQKAKDNSAKGDKKLS